MGFQEFCFKNAKFERPSRHSSEDVEQTIGYLRLELMEEVQAGDTDLEIIGKQVLFKNMEQNEITETVEENKRCPSTMP